MLLGLLCTSPSVLTAAPMGGHCCHSPGFPGKGLRGGEAESVPLSGARAQASGSARTPLHSCECWGQEVGGHRGCLGRVAQSLVSQGQYRTVLYDSWVKQLVAHHVPHSAEPTLIGTGNPVKIRSWQIAHPGGLEQLGWV